MFNLHFQLFTVRYVHLVNFIILFLDLSEVDRQHTENLEEGIPADLHLVFCKLCSERLF